MYPHIVVIRRVKSNEFYWKIYFENTLSDILAKYMLSIRDFKLATHENRQNECKILKIKLEKTK